MDTGPTFNIERKGSTDGGVHLQMFHTYFCSQLFTVKSDHKLLERIMLKNLISALPRFQQMILHMQPYDLVIKYRSSKEMLLADPLSHLLSWEEHKVIPFSLWVDNIIFSVMLLSQIRWEASSLKLSVVYHLHIVGQPTTTPILLGHAQWAVH